MGSTPTAVPRLTSRTWLPGPNSSDSSHGTRKRAQVRLAAGARSCGTVALELAPGRSGPLDNSEADRRQPTRAVLVDSDSTPKRRSTAFGTTGRLGLPPTWMHCRETLVGPRSVGWRGGPRPVASAGARGQHRRQLDSDTSDTLAHLALDRQPPKPQPCNGSREKAIAGYPGVVQAIPCAPKPTNCRGAGALTPLAYSAVTGV